VRFRLVFNNNGSGLTRDGALLSQHLTSLGHQVQTEGLASTLRSRLSRVPLGIWRRQDVVDANIFLESIADRWLPAARWNVLIPNPEWTLDRDLERLSQIDLVLPKTREGLRAFQHLGPPVRLLGFTSVDRRTRPGLAATGTLKFLHVAGRSEQKGTGILIRAWTLRPDWPSLTVVQRPQRPDHWIREVKLPNLRHLIGHLPDGQLRRLQNDHAVHITPSEAEGFGHTIVEGMSCGGVVVTTDAPPMNELVQPDRGMLVAAERSARQRLGTNYYVGLDHLTEAVEKVLALSPAQREAMGRRARAWFESNNETFVRNLASVLQLFQTPSGR